MKKVLLAAIFFAFVSTASAASITVESGGISLINFDDSGYGSIADPWIIEASVTDSGVIRWADGLGGNTTGTEHRSGKFLEITTINDSNAIWASFELELQVILGIPSGEYDGLSFAQGSNFVFTSDVFSLVTHIEDSRDYLNFHNGIVGIGESATFLIAITDFAVNFNNPFYLSLTPNIHEEDDTSTIPEPSTWAMMIGGLGILACRLRRRKL